MALLLSGTRVYGNTNIDSVLVLGNTAPFDATSNTTGSLRVTGGVGITGNLYTGNIILGGANSLIFGDGTRQTTAASYNSGIDTTQNTRIDAVFTTANNALANNGSLITVNSASQLYVTNTTDATTSGTGALQVAGGLGVARTMWANTIELNAGTTAVAPLNFATTGSVLTTPAQGSVEFDANNLFITTNTTVGPGRSIILAPQYGKLAANATVTSGSAFFTAAVRPALLVGHMYHFKYYLAFQKNTSGTVTYSFTPSTGTFIQLHAHAKTFVQGAVLAAVTNMASISTNNSATTNSTASASLAASAICTAFIEGFVIPSTNMRMQLNVTTGAGTVNSALGSNFIFTDLGLATTIGNIG